MLRQCHPNLPVENWEGAAAPSICGPTFPALNKGLFPYSSASITGERLVRDLDPARGIVLLEWNTYRDIDPALVLAPSYIGLEDQKKAMRGYPCVGSVPLSFLLTGAR